ncbi:MAG: MFS transporter [Candidatus Acetothermia bacterium]|jgi:MFS family permease|nr:MFS transporter [Candidatus Acetothermia bacterium]MDH7505209.1 MFS transporter [Candidatus Acetothermia bacterium]
MAGTSGVEEVLTREVAGPRRLVRALRSRNYRLYFGGQGLSLIGTWMQRVAMSWLVYRLTGSTLLLGVVGFASQIPTFIFAPFAGVLADRVNRRTVIIVTQALAMLQALLLAALVLTGAIAVWQIVVLGVFLGVINAFDMPVRQSFVVEMVENKEDLGNAIALNSSMVNGARLIGPSIAGVLVAAVGEGICFLINGLSYLAVIAALLAMTITRHEVRPQGPHGWRGLREGFLYAFNFAPIKAVLLLLALVSLVGMPYTVLMPVFAQEILRGGPSTLGFLMGATGVGAMLGGIYLASRRSVLGLGRFIPLATGIFGLGLVAFSLSRALWLSLLLLLVVGFGMTAQAASSNTVLQTIVEEDKRGRLMSFYTMAFMGMVPFGSLLAGGLASLIGTPRTVMVGGLVSIAGGLLFIQRISAYLRRETAPQKVCEIWKSR